MKTIYLHICYCLNEAVTFEKKESLNGICIEINFKGKKENLIIKDFKDFKLRTFKTRTSISFFYPLEVKDSLNVKKDVVFINKTEKLLYEKYKFDFFSLKLIDKTVKPDVWTSDDDGNLIQVDWGLK